MNVNEILMIFCQYGFRKASMEDIAKAAGLSRQSIYKKFGSKEAIFEWALIEAVGLAFDATMSALSDETKSTKDRIAQAFDRWAGDHVGILRSTPHGMEMLNHANEMFAKDPNLDRKSETVFYGAVADLILRDGHAKSQKDAEDKSYTLAMTSKGLLFYATDTAEFRQGMDRALRAVLPSM